jgi:YD repeat-containing protein
MNSTMTLRQAVRWRPVTRHPAGFQLLEKIAAGRLLEIRLPDGSSRLFGEGEHGVTHARA